jgi:phosphatidylinositol alpha-1,6-mannosyltransferase
MSGLLITNDFPPMPGGEAAYYARICGTVADRVIVLAPRLPQDRRFDERQPYRVIRRWMPISPHPAARLVQMTLVFLYALPVLRRQRVEVVHVGHLYLGLVALVLGRLFRVPYVLYLHGGEMASYMRSRLVRAVVRAIVREARLVVVNSTFTRRHFEELAIRPARVEVLTMSVEVERFLPDLDAAEVRAKYGLDGHCVILTVGRLVERKGHDVVIRALARVQRSVGEALYLIAGCGPYEPRLRRLSHELGCEPRVRFLGQVPDADLPALYAACDVFAMPSRALAERDGVEGFGIAFVEAGAAAKPVVGGRSGGIADAVIDGVTGLLVEPTSVEDVAGALVSLLRDREHAARLGANGRRRAEALEAAWPATVQRIWQAAGGVR